MAQREATRDTMQVIFESLRCRLQPDASGADLDSPQTRADVLDALRELDYRPAILASHGFYEDSGGVFLVSVLERYSLLSLRSHERASPNGCSSFSILRTTQAESPTGPAYRA
ncbi:MAG: hypothetical protein GWP74_16640 [Proteobacteria bacterium]|nr:hypothetical protein [Pseudomonadota bacterium]